jgi:DNA-binding protein, YbaB/EbfC family
LTIKATDFRDEIVLGKKKSTGILFVFRALLVLDGTILAEMDKFFDFSNEPRQIRRMYCMKARLPQGYGGGGASNLQQIARQAQKLQDEMDVVTSELNEKEYSATAGGDAVKATVTGKMEVKAIEMKPEVVDPEDVEMLSDLIIAAVNEALRTAAADKNERMEQISGGLNVPGFI